MAPAVIAATGRGARRDQSQMSIPRRSSGSGARVRGGIPMCETNAPRASYQTLGSQPGSASKGGEKPPRNRRGNAFRNTDLPA